MVKSAMPNIEETIYRLRAGNERARLDKFLATELPDISRTRLKGLIESGHVRVGGETIAEPAYRVKPEAEIKLTLPKASSVQAPEPQAIGTVAAGTRRRRQRLRRRCHYAAFDEIG